MDPDGVGGGAQPALAQRLDVDDVVVAVLREGQLRRGVGDGECVYLFVSLSPE